MRTAFARDATTTIHRRRFGFVRMSARIAVLISGEGRNLQALIDACADGRIDGRIVCVLSNRAEAGGVRRAQRAGIATEVLSHREIGRASCRERVDQYGVIWVVAVLFKNKIHMSRSYLTIREQIS